MSTRNNKNYRPSRKSKNELLASITRKNVWYSNTVPRNIIDLERVTRMELPSALVSSTISAGGIASATTLDASVKISNFSNWAAVFKQYVILGIRIVTTIAKLDYTNSPQGQVWVRVDEDNAVGSGALVRAEKGVLDLAAFQDSETNSVITTWEPRSSEDLAWAATGTGYTPCYLKTYADPTNTLTSASDSTTRVCSQIYYMIAFRYLA